ncbi:MAG TPA: c-type cytochrome [Woeseiaceae bacterium]
MKRLNTVFFAALVASTAALVSLPAAAADGDPERGAVLAETCLGCHGIPGYRNAYPSFRVPKLGGQKPAYVEAALKSYREGTRSHPTMNAQGSALSDQDIADIAAWIGALGTAEDTVQADDVGDDQTLGQCITCHGGPAGQGLLPPPPVLSGQHEEYLEHALALYKAQGRGMTLMNGIAAPLEDEDIRRLAEFWSSREGLHTLDPNQRAPAAP